MTELYWGDWFKFQGKLVSIQLYNFPVIKLKGFKRITIWIIIKLKLEVFLLHFFLKENINYRRENPLNPEIIKYIVLNHYDVIRIRWAEIHFFSLRSDHSKRLNVIQIFTNLFEQVKRNAIHFSKDKKKIVKWELSLSYIHHSTHSKIIHREKTSVWLSLPLKVTLLLVIYLYVTLITSSQVKIKRRKLFETTALNEGIIQLFR